MTTKRKLASLIRDEDKAVREYGHEASVSPKQESRTFRHIQREERTHASSLRRMRRRRSR